VILFEWVLVDAFVVSPVRGAGGLRRCGRRRSRLGSRAT
jgi:hypothetical protein